MIGLCTEHIMRAGGLGTWIQWLYLFWWLGTRWTFLNNSGSWRNNSRLLLSLLSLLSLFTFSLTLSLTHPARLANNLYLERSLQRYPPSHIVRQQSSIGSLAPIVHSQLGIVVMLLLLNSPETG